MLVPQFSKISIAGKCMTSAYLKLVPCLCIGWIQIQLSISKLSCLVTQKTRKDDRCFNFEKVLDLDSTNYMDLVKSIVQQYPPGYLEVAHVQHYDDSLKTFPEVKCDQDLMSMFEKHHKTKVVHMFVAYCDPSEMYEPITEWNFDEEEQLNMNTEETKDDSYLRNPLPENEFVGVDEEGMYLQIVPTDNVGKHVDGDSDGGGEGDG